MSNENFKGHENRDEREGTSLTLLRGILIILLRKVYGTVEHPETHFLRHVFRKKSFFNPTNRTKFSASGGEKLVLLVGLKNLLFLHKCVYGTVGLFIDIDAK